MAVQSVSLVCLGYTLSVVRSSKARPLKSAEFGCRRNAVNCLDSLGQNSALDNEKPLHCGDYFNFVISIIVA